MAVDDGVSTTLPEFAAHDRRFRERFALFLREAADLWRQRRTDTFTPIDVAMATHTVTIQGAIEPDIVEHFLATDREFEGVEVEVQAGDELTLYIPTSRVPKRLLLNFNVTDGAGRRLPLVTRMDDAPIIADGLADRFGLVAPTLSQDKLDALRYVLTALIYLNPEDLVTQVGDWARYAGKGFGSGGGLDTGSLGEWVELDADFYETNFGQLLAYVLERRFVDDRADDSFLRIPSSLGQPLSAFPSLTQLLLHASRDIARVTFAFTPPASAEHVDHLAQVAKERELQVSDAALSLAARVREHFLPGIDVLQSASQAADGADVVAALINDIETWTPFLIANVRIDESFVLRTEETVWFTREAERDEQVYPLTLTDAMSSHVELRLDDPEIYIPLRPSPARGMRQEFDPQSVYFRGLLRNVPFSDGGSSAFRDIRIAGDPAVIFEGEVATSERMMHFYATHSEGEHTHLTKIEHVQLIVPIKLTRIVHYAFLGATSALWVAAFFIGWQAWWVGVGHGQLSSHLIAPVVTLSALSVTVGLWLVQAQYKSALVARKLRSWRFACLVAVGVIVVSMAAMMIAALSWGGLKSDSATNPPSNSSTKNKRTKPVNTPSVTTPTVTAPTTTAPRTTTPPRTTTSRTSTRPATSTGTTPKGP
jgi:hypothetical protein